MSVGGGSIESDNKFTNIGEQLALLNCQGFVSSLCSLLSYKKTIPTIQYLYDSNSYNNTIARLLSDKFNHYGSDKSVHHGYEAVYSNILTTLGVNNSLNILEIGLGTNNTKIVSNMSSGGKPGASLRAFRDLCPNSNIYGADIDSTILFEEDRIQTCQMDQIEYRTYKNIISSFGNIKYDLIIDDGLHSINTNINTIVFGLNNINSNGYIVIEDVYNPNQIWNTIACVMSDVLDIKLFQCKADRGLIITIQLVK